MYLDLKFCDSDCDSLSDNVNSLMIISIPVHQITAEKGILVVNRKGVIVSHIFYCTYIILYMRMRPTLFWD